MARSIRRNPENHRARNLFLFGTGTALVAAGLYAAYEAGQNDLLNPPNNPDSSDTIGLPEVDTSDEESDVYPTELPLMDEELDTTPGLNSYETDITFDNAADFAQLLESYMVSGNQEQAQNIIGQIMMEGPTVYGARMDFREPEDLYLGFPENAVLNFSNMENRFLSRITTESIRASRSMTETELLAFRSNPALNNSRSTVFYTEGGQAFSYLQANQYDNLDVMSLQQAYDILKVVGIWDEYTPEQRTSFAFNLIEGWDNQREEGARYAGDHAIQYLNDHGQLVTLGTVGRGEGGILVCRIEADDNSDERDEQLLTTRRVMVTEQENETNIETPFGELSRYGHWGSTVVIDVEGLQEIANATTGNERLTRILNAVLNTHGAYERIDLDTAFNGQAAPQRQTVNGIPTSYEIGGLTYSEEAFQEGDFTFLTRPCGEAAPVVQEVVPTAVPVQPEQPPHNPPPQETPPPEEEIKDSPGDGVNTDGETENPPEGGQEIIDGEIDTDGDGEGDVPDNVGSGR